MLIYVKYCFQVRDFTSNLLCLPSAPVANWLRQFWSIHVQEKIMRLPRLLSKIDTRLEQEARSGLHRLAVVVRFLGSPKGFRLVGYGVIVAAAVTPVFVWTSLSRFQAETSYSHLPYHAPVVLVVGLVIIEVALFMWVRMLAFGHERIRRRRERGVSGDLLVTPEGAVQPPEGLVAGVANGSASPAGKAIDNGERGCYASTEATAPNPQKDPFRERLRTDQELPRHRPRVLIVDDDAGTRMKLRKQLIRLGVTSETVSNGQQALEAVEQEPWDMILMDGHMPELDGVEAAMAIRRRALLPAGVPIIIVTSDHSREFQERCFQAAVTGFYHKPLGHLVLRHLVEVYLDETTGVDQPNPPN